MRMVEAVVKDVTRDNTDHLISFCIPPEEQSKFYSIEGMDAKRKWAMRMLDEKKILLN